LTPPRDQICAGAGTEVLLGTEAEQERRPSSQPALTAGGTGSNDEDGDDGASTTSSFSVRRPRAVASWLALTADKGGDLDSC
jgi:hypothetical protein